MLLSILNTSRSSPGQPDQHPLRVRGVHEPPAGVWPRGRPVSRYLLQEGGGQANRSSTVPSSHLPYTALPPSQYSSISITSLSLFSCNQTIKDSICILDIIKGTDININEIFHVNLNVSNKSIENSSMDKITPKRKHYVHIFCLDHEFLLLQNVSKYLHCSLIFLNLVIYHFVPAARSYIPVRICS